MAKLIIIFGPQAVGKMTVGQELEKLTDLKLFHNHMTIDLVAPFFSYGSTTGKRLVKYFRKKIFRAVASSDLEGMIFTFVWAFNKQSDWYYIKNVSDIFERKDGTVYYVELEAPLEERLIRNHHPHRLSHKPTKRNLEKSELDLRTSMEKYRLNSQPGELKFQNYLKIDNTELNPEEVAQKIKKSFKL
jgi:hypothetical protein